MKDAKGHGSEKRGVHSSGVEQIGKPEGAEARELRLFADNDAQLYRSSFTPVVNNLAKKMGKGVYDHEKAKKLWGYHADRAAQSYAKQHGGAGGQWHKMFSPAVRREAASHWADQHKSGGYK